MGHLLLGSSYNCNAQKCSPFKESLFNVFAAPHSQGQRYIQLALPIRQWQLGPIRLQSQLRDSTIIAGTGYNYKNKGFACATALRFFS